MTVAETYIKNNLLREGTVHYVEARHHAERGIAAYTIGQSTDGVEKLQATQQFIDLLNSQNEEFKQVRTWANSEVSKVNPIERVQRGLTSHVSDVVNSPRTQAALGTAISAVAITAGVIANGAVERLVSTLLGRSSSS